MIPLQVQAFVFDNISRLNSHHFVPNLKTTAKRYTTAYSAQNREGLTLLFTHCIGAHKEQWEPIIQRLFHTQQCKDAVHRIREAWSFDRQNHGDAALLNREALRDHSEGVSVFEWVPVIASFIRSPRMKGHHLVALGQSAGAAAMVLLAAEFPASRLPLLALVLVEPVMMTRQLFSASTDDWMAAVNLLVSATSVRRDTWDSREAAFNWFKERLPWKVWDPRVIRLLSEHGLQETMAGVILKCSKEQEAVSYRDAKPQFDATVLLSRVSRAIPVHVIWGTTNDLVPELTKESLTDVSEGRVVASVTKVHGAGHMIVQEQPDRLADVISKILDSVQTSHMHRSRL